MLTAVFKVFCVAVIYLLLAGAASKYRLFLHYIPWQVLPKYLAAAAVFLLVYCKFLRERLQFWETFFHELAHAFFALLCFNRTVLLHVTPGRGEHGSHGSGNFLISLAPYWFPVHTAFLVLISVFVAREFSLYFNFAMALSYTWHLVTVKNQYGNHQTDITRSGAIFSAIFVWGMNLLCGLTFLAYLAASHKAFLLLARHTGKQAWALAAAPFKMLW